MMIVVVEAGVVVEGLAVENVVVEEVIVGAVTQVQSDAGVPSGVPTASFPKPPPACKAAAARGCCWDATTHGAGQKHTGR
jgi:hypothetical protein